MAVRESSALVNMTAFINIFTGLSWAAIFVGILATVAVVTITATTSKGERMHKKVLHLLFN